MKKIHPPAKRLTFKRYQRGATILEYIIYSVLALGVLAGIAVFATTANNKSNATGLAKGAAGSQIATRNFYQNGSFGTGSLNAELIAASNIIPGDWNISGSTITGQGDTDIVFTGMGLTYSISIAKLNQDTCQILVASSSNAQWASVTVSGSAAGTAITKWPITQAVAAKTTACGAPATNGLTVVFTSK